MQDSFKIDRFAGELIFSDEATFHLPGKVHRHNVRTWRTENICVITEHVRDSPKVNAFCAISKEKGYGPFSFETPTVTGMISLDKSENWPIPQLNEDSNCYIFQQVWLTTTETSEVILIKICHRDGEDAEDKKTTR
jgi:hypothetical protein